MNPHYPASCMKFRYWTWYHLKILTAKRVCRAITLRSVLWLTRKYRPKGFTPYLRLFVVEEAASPQYPTSAFISIHQIVKCGKRENGEPTWQHMSPWRSAFLPSGRPLFRTISATAGLYGQLNIVNIVNTSRDYVVVHKEIARC
jgi:hypothetical protein